MIDEVQCGTGRTGRWFAHQWADIRPDVMPLAKGLASGIPVGAVVAGERAAGLFTPGSHGTTFGGNLLAMRAGITTIEVMEDEHLMKRAASTGERIMAGIRSAFAGNPGVVDVRGQGLMIGIELDRPCDDLVGKALEAGLFLNVTASSVIRLLPPQVFDDGHADHLVERLVPLIAARLDN